MARSPIVRFACVLVALTVALLFVQPNRASAAGITLAPTSGPSGTVVTITGGPFTASQPVNVYFNGTLVKTVTADAAGNIPAGTTFTVPSVAAGTYQVIAAGGSAAYSANFQVTPNTATIALMPSSGPAGTVVTVNGSGFGASQAVNVYFNGTLMTTATATASGTFSTSITVPAGTAPGTYPVTATSATVAASAPFTVPGATTPTVQKFVSINGSAYGTTGTARPGSQLQYQVRVINSSGSTIPGVTINDTLQPGQTLLVYPGFPCTYNAATNSLLCPVGNLPPGTAASVFIVTAVNSGFTGTINNTATATSTNGTSTPSNTTTVVVAPATPVPVAGNFILCGVVTSASGSLISVNGMTIPIATGVVPTGTAIVVTVNLCITFTITNGVATTVVASPNLAALPVVCGVFATGTAAGFINVGGMAVPVASGAFSTTVLVPGIVYCFVFNTSGQVFIVLTGIPTSVVPPARHHHFQWAHPRVPWKHIAP